MGSRTRKKKIDAEMGWCSNVEEEVKGWAGWELRFGSRKRPQAAAPLPIITKHFKTNLEGEKDLEKEDRVFSKYSKAQDYILDLK
jgi:hypothetical protein